MKGLHFEWVHNMLEVIQRKYMELPSIELDVCGFEYQMTVLESLDLV